MQCRFCHRCQCRQNETTENETTEIDMNQRYSSHPVTFQLNSELYVALAEKSEGEAFDVVRNVPDKNGAETRLCGRFDSRTFGKHFLLTRKCISPPRIKELKHTTAMIETWKDAVAQLKQNTARTLTT